MEIEQGAVPGHGGASVETGEEDLGGGVGV